MSTNVCPPAWSEDVHTTNNTIFMRIGHHSITGKISLVKNSSPESKHYKNVVIVVDWNRFNFSDIPFPPFTAASLIRKDTSNSYAQQPSIVLLPLALSLIY